MRTARKFVSKELKGKVNLRTLMKFLQKTGYGIIFYNRDTENIIINKYGLGAYSKTVNAFTVCSKNEKLVFLNGTMPLDDKLYAMLHETAHIVLNHLEADMRLTNPRFQEMQAEAFAYEVLCRASVKADEEAAVIILI